MNKRNIISAILFFLAASYAHCERSAWFGAELGDNGLEIVPHNVNRKYVTIAENLNPYVSARLFRDDNEWLDVTDASTWTGGVSIVRNGIYKGMILASQTGVFELTAIYTSFDNTIPVTVITPNDSDNDGLPDFWEMQRFGNLNSGASGDSDNDGMNNWSEFTNGTDPTNATVVFSFPPLHRYPYSNGFYAGPDVNLEWFGSTTLGRYELEAAIWPDCTKTIYRSEICDTNDIGDPIVHAANLREGIGTQCAYRIRAAFTNTAGWTDWNNWRPFKVLEPLTNHTLYLENNEPLRGCYFFFWDYNTNALINKWHERGYAQSSIDNAIEAIEERELPINWKTDDEVCSNELTFLRNELELNTVFLDQWAWRCFVGGISISNMALPGDPPDLTNIFDLTYWSPQFNRDNTLCQSNNIKFLPWLSISEHRGMAQTHANTVNKTNQQVYNFLENKYNTDPIEMTLNRRSSTLYQNVLADITGTNYQKTWIRFINEFVEKYSENTNDILNSLVKVKNRGNVATMVAPIVEHKISYILDFGGKAVNEFVLWLKYRYGKIEYLNNSWDANLVEWKESVPYNVTTNYIPSFHIDYEDTDLFRWSDRGTPQMLVRACEDFEEFTIERQIGGWLKIREDVLKIRPVCFAIEYAGTFYSTIGINKPTRRDIPIHRMADFADVIIQRHGFDVDTTRQKSAYADWSKSGKYVIYAPKPVTNFEDHTSLIRHYTKSAYSAGANAGFYSWNELWDLTAIIFKFKIAATNGAKRFFNSVNQRETSLLENGSFENGHNRYIPGWSAVPSTYAYIDPSKSIDGEKCLRLEENCFVTIKSETVNCNNTKPHLLLYYAFIDGEIGTNQVTIDITIGNSLSKIIEFSTNTFFSETQQCDAELLAQSQGYSAQQIELDNSWKETENHWIPFYEFYESGELSGAETLQLDIQTPNGVKLYIDRISLTEIY